MAGDDERSALTTGFDAMSLLEALPDPVVVVGTDARLVWANAAASSTLGWERAKMGARDAWDRIERAMPGDFDKDGR